MKLEQFYGTSVDQTIKSDKPRRPKLVWAICIWYLFSVAWMGISFWMLVTRRIDMPPATDAYLANLSMIDLALSLVGIVLTLATVVSLFLLRKIASRLLATLFALGLLATVKAAFDPMWIASMKETPAGFIGMLIGWTVMVIIIKYQLHLEDKGILT